MDYLARREHSKLQLQRKLLEKFPDCGLTEVEAVIQQLEAENLQSDDRFTESYCFSKSDRGYGFAYIRHHLQGAGVGSALIEKHLLSYNDEFWTERLVELLGRKRIHQWPDFGSREWQRLNRYLVGRGFSPMQIRAAVQMMEESQ